MAPTKTAFVLFADTPLLGQAGMRFQGIFNDHDRLKLYTTFIEDFDKNCKSQNIDLWLTCQEVFQDNLLLQHFPNIKGTKVASGSMNERISTLTNHFLTYQNYELVVFIFDVFTFIGKDILTKISPHFRLTKRGVMLLRDEDSKQLEALALSFPFIRIFEGIIWNKDDVYKDIKRQCQDNGTPCKVVSQRNLALTQPQSQYEEFIASLSNELPSFCKTLESIVKKDS